MAAGGRIELADIFRQHGQAYLAEHTLAPSQAKAWRAIVSCRTEALGGELAFSLVLHTWSQNLMRHLHVHALVASGALAADGQWVNSRRGFLFPVKALSKVFREKFIDALKLARQEGRLRHAEADDDGKWRQLMIALRRHDWVVYAKQPLGGPAQVLDYLSRYTHRVAISNERLVSLNDGRVAFRVRDNACAGKKRIERLPAEAFIGRFLLHVLPSGFKRIRHYGMLAPCHKKEKLAVCRVQRWKCRRRTRPSLKPCRHSCSGWRTSILAAALAAGQAGSKWWA